MIMVQLIENSRSVYVLGPRNVQTKVTLAKLSELMRALCVEMDIYDIGQGL